MALSLVTPPSADAEAVTLEHAKLQCKLEDVTYDDSFLTDIIIPAALDRANLHTQRQILTATWDLKLDCFPCEPYIEIPRPPLVSVTSVSYVDGNGATQTLVVTTDYLVDAPAGPRGRRGRVALAYGKSWPTTRDQINAVTVRFVCGYGTTPTAIPGLLREAMLLDVATLYVQRQNVITGTIVAELPGRSNQIYTSFKSRETQRRAA